MGRCKGESLFIGSKLESSVRLVANVSALASLRISQPDAPVDVIPCTHDHVPLGIWRRPESRLGSASSRDRIRSIEVWGHQPSVLLPKTNLERAEE